MRGGTRRVQTDSKAINTSLPFLAFFDDRQRNPAVALRGRFLTSASNLSLPFTRLLYRDGGTRLGAQHCQPIKSLRGNDQGPELGCHTVM